MSINWWTLALQAVNVLILIWLLSRLFWRPVAQAIAARQIAANDLLDTAKSTHQKADVTLDEINKTRMGLAAERDALLAETAKTSEATAKVALAEASSKAEAQLAAAQLALDAQSDALHASFAANAAVLAVEIARKLLMRLDTVVIQASFLDLLVEDIERMSADDKEVLIGTTDGIDLVSALDLNTESRQRIAEAVNKSLGSSLQLNFLNDPELIAGFEMRTAHFVLRDSWQSDLAGIQEELNNAA